MNRANRRRAARIEAALRAYADKIGADYGAESAEEKVSDLLTDLLHYSEREGVLFEVCLWRARGNYSEERRAGK